MKALAHACLLLTLTFAVTGCVKFKQVWSINPDGSGKMTQTIGFSETALLAANEDPFASLDRPEDMINPDDQGWVAFTRPQIKTEGGYKYATFTGYFENINEVTFQGSGGQGDMQTTSYHFADGTFTISDSMLSQIIMALHEDEELKNPLVRADMRKNLAGMEFSESYDLPGDVTKVTGYTADGDTTKTTVTIEELIAASNGKIEGLKNDEQTITFTSAGWEGQEAAWNTELAAAKAEWAAMKNNVPVGAGAE